MPEGPAPGRVEAERRAFYEGALCQVRRSLRPREHTRIVSGRPFSRRLAPITAHHGRAQAVSRPRSGEWNERSLDTAEHARILTDGAGRPSPVP